MQDGGMFKSFESPVPGFVSSTAKSEFKNFALNSVRSLPQEGFLGKISQFSNSQAFDSIAPLLGVSTQATYVGTSFFGNIVTSVMPEYAPLIANVASGVGIDLGIAAITPAMMDAAILDGAIAPVAGAASGSTAGTAVAGIASKLGLTPVLAAVNTAIQSLNAIIPGLGVAVSALVMAVAGKAIEKAVLFIKKHAEDLKIIGAIAVGGGALIGSVPVVILGGLVFIPTVLKTGLSPARFIRRTFRFFGQIGRAMVITIATPIIITILVIPVAVALILFIINSGAYVVPPSSLTGIYEDPYVKVEKTANPTGPFTNASLPLPVEYTIKITAKISPLSNVRLDYKCQVFSKGTPPACPSIGNSIPTTDKIGTISPSKPFSFSYTMKYSGNSFKDSLIIDTITATADVPEKIGTSSEGSAAIVIGNPPSACFTFDNSWSVTDKNQVIAAAAELSQATTFMTTLCHAWGTIPLSYSGEPEPYAGFFTGSGIRFYRYGLSYGVHGTLYTLAHESGHAYAAKVSGIYNLFTHTAGLTEKICTYLPSYHPPSEDFAEMIGLYIAKTPNVSNGCMTNFKTQYANYWQFAHDHIFFQNLGW
jgi:hypothetical protein